MLSPYKNTGLGGIGKKIYRPHHMTSLPSITNKQAEILKLLYRFRFLNREQVQKLLHHKNKVRSSRWLKDLKEKQYVQWIYDAHDFVNKTKPAIYYLSLHGIRYVRSSGNYPDEELRKRYKEPSRKQVFIDRCLLIADCCLALQAKSKSNGDLRYTWVLPADYADPGSTYYFMNELKPHLCFIKQNDEQVTGYLLEALDPLMPRYAVKKRIKDYTEYVLSGCWQDETGYDDSPIILIACPTVADLMYAKRRARKEIEDNDMDEDEASRIRFATIEKVKQLGATARIWEEV